MPEALIHNREEMIAFAKEHIQHREYPFRIKIADGRDRSAEQNALMWVWAAETSTYTGESKTEVQARWKLDTGLPLLMGSDERFRDIFDQLLFENSLDSGERVPKPREILLNYLEDPSPLDITRLMTITQMNEFLDAVYRRETLAGHNLTDPEALK